MSDDRIVLLGTKGGPSLRSIDRMQPSSLLEIGGHVIVVDCGLGVTRSIVLAGTNLADIDHIFITHLHSDHIIELGALLHTIWTTNLTKPITVHGPKGIKDCIEGFYSALQFDIHLRIEDEGRTDIRHMINVDEYGEGVIMDDSLRVDALTVNHPPVKDCFALRFECQGWVVTFSADTAMFPPLASFAKNSDILVHEAMLGEGIDYLIAKTMNASRLREHLLESHTLAEDAGRIANDANVGALILYHLVPVIGPAVSNDNWISAVRKNWNGPLFIGHDGLEIKRSH